jgi:anti-sigma factor RsiW
VSDVRCADARERLDALADGELPPRDAEALGAHLAACAECSAELEATLDGVREIRERLAPYRASDVLRGRVRAALRAELAAESAGAPKTVRRAAPRRLAWPWRRLAAAVVLLATGGVATLATQRVAARRADDAVAREVEASHVRSLMLAHLLDVPSTDQHTVKPWFAGKVDFSPPVVRLDASGVVLLGGRVDYVRGRPAAVIVYRLRQHVINLYVWPAPDDADADPAESEVAGYHLVRWRAGGLEQWAVSDLNPTELRAVATAIRSASGRAAPPR